MSFNSPISAVDCAPVNPLAALGSQLQQAQTFNQSTHSKHSASSQPSQAFLQRPHLQHVNQQPQSTSGHVTTHDPNVAHFQAAFSQPQHAINRSSPDHMIESFRRMEMADNPAWQHEFEARQMNSIHAAIVQGAAPQHHIPSQAINQPNWSAEFEANSHANSMRQQQFRPINQPMQFSQPMNHSMMMHQRPGFAPMMPMNYMQRPQLSYQPQSMFNQSMSQAPSQSFQQPKMSQVDETKVDEPNIMDEIYQQQATDAGYAEAMESQQDALNAEHLNSFVNDSNVQSTVQPGFGGGLNGEMIEKLMNSDDPKWRNSKFLSFISKIKEGKIEFRDNQAIEREPTTDQASGVTTGQEWASEFASNDAAVNEAAWPTAWAEDFEQRNGMRPLASEAEIAAMAAGWSGPINHAAEDEKVWQQEYERVVNGPAEAVSESSNMTDEQRHWQQAFAQYEEFDGFNEMNWREALEAAKNNDDYQTSYNDSITMSDPEYPFTDQVNPFMEHPSPFDEGVRLLAAGQLKEAIQAFEAAVRLDDTHSEAWCLLGTAQAENENEREAIAALLKAVSLDPYNLQALLQLGVSYTNDLEEHRALNYLSTWLESNPDYQHESIIAAKNSINEYEQFYGGAVNRHAMDSTLHGQVTSMFREALRLHPSDSSLHTVMGVLYHLSNDFDASIESFKTALKHNPDSAQLWNKLGATLANSNRSSEAAHAYQRALALRPNYVRALANLAISYANQAQHDEAVVYYLKTLSCNQKADHIWSYLRVSLAHMGKEQLVDLTHGKNVDAFRAFYDF